jgi:hypothetical protein
MWSWLKPRPRFYGEEITFEQLEERIVLDASVPAAAHTESVHQDAPAPVNHAAPDASHDSASASPVATGTAPAPDAQVASSGSTTAQADHHGLNVVLISSAVDQAQALSAAVAPGTMVLVYDAEHDDLSSINAQLKSLVDSYGEKIGHLAFVTHGSDGAINLSDSQTVNGVKVLSNPEPWRELGALLDSGARIDLYGCDAGKGFMGALLVSAVSHETNAAVWASDDITGTTSGADWNLEVRCGSSSLSPLIEENLIQDDAISLAYYQQVWYGQCVYGHDFNLQTNDPHIVGSLPWGYYIEVAGDVDGWTPSWWPGMDVRDETENVVITTLHGGSWIGSLINPNMTVSGESQHDFVIDYFDHMEDPSNYYSYDLYLTYSPYLNHMIPAWTNEINLSPDHQIHWNIHMGSGIQEVDSNWWNTNYDIHTQANYVYVLMAWNDKPYAENGGIPDQPMNETGIKTINLSDYFQDVEDGDALTYTYTLVDSSDARIFYPGGITLDNVHKTLTLDPSFYGTATIKVTATDSGLEYGLSKLTLDETFTVTLNPINDPPYATNGGLPAITTYKDAPNTVIGLADYFHDRKDADDLTYSITANSNEPLFNWVSLVGGDLVLCYKSGAYGDATITVQALDQGRGSAPALSLDETFTVTVNEYDTPYIEHGGIPDIVTPETAGHTVVDLSNYFHDAIDGDNLKYTVVNNSKPELFATDGIVIDNDHHTLTLTYAAGVYGASELTIHAENQQGHVMSVEDTFSLTVYAVNTAPYITDGGLPDIRVEEDSGPTVIDLSQYFHDLEDGDNLTYSVSYYGWPIADATVDNDTHLLTIDYVPGRGGSGYVEIQAYDHGKDSRPNVMWVWDDFNATVLTYNTPPYAENGGIPDYVVSGGYVAPIDLGQFFHDAQDGDNLMYSVVGNTNGELVPWVSIGSGWATVNVKPDAHGEAQIIIRATDHSNGVDPQLYLDETFTLTVTPPVDVASVTGMPGSVSLNEYQTESFSAHISGPYPDGVTDLTATVTFTAAHGTLALAETSGLTFNWAYPNGGHQAVFSGTVDDLNGALASITYQPDSYYFGSDTVTIVANGTWHFGTITWVNDEAVTVVTISPVNERPVLSGSPDESYQPIHVTEDTGHTFTGIQVYDPDDRGAGTLWAKVTLQVEHGTLWLDWIPYGLQFTSGEGNGQSTVEFTGAIQDIDYALMSFEYQPASDYYGPDNLVIHVDDLANGGTPTLTVDGSVSIVVDEINESPQIVVTHTSAFSLDEDTPSPLTGISVSDPHDGDPASLMVKVKLVSSHGALELGTVEGVQYTAGLESGKHAVEFTGSIDQVNQALSSLVFRPDKDFAGSDLIHMVVDDLANGGSNPGPLLAQQNLTITVRPVNDAPYAHDASIPPQSVDEDTLLTTINLSDYFHDLEDGDNLTYSIVSVTNTGLFITDGVVINPDHTLTLDYAPQMNGVCSITIRALDHGQGQSPAATFDETFTVEVKPVNDPPSLLIGPDSLFLNEDFSATFGQIVVSDPFDGKEDALQAQVTLSVAHGTLDFVAAPSGVSFTAGKESGHSNIEFTGNIRDVNLALAALRYTADGDFNGLDTLTVHVDDLANGGSNSGRWTADGMVRITVNPLCDAPLTSDNDQLVGDEECLIPLTGWDFSDSRDNVAGGSSANDKAYLIIKDLPANGVLLHNGAAITAADVDPVVGYKLSWTDANNGSLQFQGTIDWNGRTDFHFTVQDTGLSDALNKNESLPHKATITALAVNDPPTATVPPLQFINTDVSHYIVVTGVCVADVDAHEGTGLVRASLSVEHGVLGLAGTVGSAVTITGSLGDVNRALEGVTYSPSSYIGNSDTITLTANDLGNTGKGGPLEVTKTIPISISAYAGNHFETEMAHRIAAGTLDLLHDGSASPAPLVNAPFQLAEESSQRIWLYESRGTLVNAHTQVMGFQSLIDLTEDHRQDRARQVENSLVSADEYRRPRIFDERLSLEEFFARFDDGDVYALKNKPRLVLDAEEIKLGEWLAGVIGPMDWAELHHRDRMAGAEDTAEHKRAPTNVAIDVDQVRAMDLFTLKSEEDRFTYPARAASGSESRISRTFDLNEINVAELLTS